MSGEETDLAAVPGDDTASEHLFDYDGTAPLDPGDLGVGGSGTAPWCTI
ncbi:MAG: hypothetical protein GXY82_02700 [Methanospirillum sp.]|nr:hypothetical protein [Methanospirillum sp.]